MSLLGISPEFASQHAPLAVLEGSAARVLSPNGASAADLALAIDVGVGPVWRAVSPEPATDALVEAVFR